MPTTPDHEPDAEETRDLLPSARATALPYTDPVEEQGVRFAREADDDDEPATATDGPGLTPDFLAPAPAQPS